MSPNLFRSGFVVCVGVLMPLLGAVADFPRLKTSNLVIQVVGLESGRGTVQYALYDSPKYFPTRIGRIAKGEVSVTSSGATIIIKGLKQGFYAVAVFHDENLNDIFDQGLFGIPLEHFGFSNDARGFFSAPAFEDAKFQVQGQRTEISIKLGK